MNARIYSNEALAPESEVALTGGAASHVAKVLRLREGDAVVLFDGSGLEYGGRVASISRQHVTVAIGPGHDPGTESKLSVTLLQGMCRSQRMDFLIQKTTELGVAAIRPVSCERSVVRLDAARGRRKVEHWHQVAISACEQSGRVRIPEIDATVTLQEALDGLNDAAGVRLLLDPDADRNVGTALESAARVTLLIGPEGGLTAAECAAARAAGFQSARLGPRTLRTETAPLAALSILQYLAGDLAC